MEDALPYSLVGNSFENFPQFSRNRIQSHLNEAKERKKSHMERPCGERKTKIAKRKRKS